MNNITTRRGSKGRRDNGSERWATYLRCSTDDQAQGDYTTIDTQREINTRHVAEHGGELVAQFADEGRSGTNLERPGYRELLRRAEAGEFDVVCVTYMSRLGRGNAFIIAEYELQKAGVRVEMVREKFDDDMMGYVTKTMTNLMDGMYPKMVRQWTITKMEEMFRQGYYVGGGIPFGYKSVPATDSPISAHGGKEPPKRLVIDAEAAPVVKQAFMLCAATHSIAAVIDYLRGGDTDRAWTYTKVKHLLTNRVYLGIARWRGMVNENAHEAIVEPVLFDAVQEALQSRAGSRRAKQGRKDTSPYYLRGMVYCACCGCRMTPADHHGRTAPVRYYNCINAHKNGVKGCSSPRVNAYALHEAVLREIHRAGQYPSRTAEILREAAKKVPSVKGQKERLALLNRALRETEKKIERITAAIETTAGGAVVPLVRRLETLEAERFSRQQEKLELEKEIAADSLRRPDAKSVQAVFAGVSQLWEHATEEERIQLMSLVVGKVEMKDKEHGNVRLLLSMDETVLKCGNTVPLREDNGTRTHGLQSHNLAL